MAGRGTEGNSAPAAAAAVADAAVVDERVRGEDTIVASRGCVTMMSPRSEPVADTKSNTQHTMIRTSSSPMPGLTSTIVYWRHALVIAGRE